MTTGTAHIVSSAAPCREYNPTRLPQSRRALQDGFRIGGAYHVEPSLNRVTGPSGVTRLEPKVMAVLVCLAERAGRVVPKDRLFEMAWPDTAVTDDVLIRAVSELR